MLNKTRQTIAQYNMIAPGDNVIIALSGGADSVSLLLALDELKNELGFRLSACHVNHRLRGGESDGDEAFVRSLCEKRDIVLDVLSIDIESLKEKHKSLEETARDIRYRYFSSLSADNGKIATAHNASDNAETVLFNLTRGTGLRGLCGIPPIRDNIIRPLISCERGEILRYLEERRQGYRTDSSNNDDVYSRNKIRLNVTPELEKINKSFISTVSNMCSLLRADDDFLRSLAEEGLKKAEIGNTQYNSHILKNLPRPVLHRAISAVLNQNGVTPSSLRINEIAEILENGGKINLCKNKFAIVKNGMFCVKFIHQNYRK